MAAATTHLEGATPLHSKASILDSTVATQTTGKSWKERKRKLKLGSRVVRWIPVIQRGIIEPHVVKARHSKALPLASLCTWASENGRECRSAAVSKEPLMHELPLAGFLLSPQGLSLGCNVRWHHSQHTVLHVLEDTTAQV